MKFGVFGFGFQRKARVVCHASARAVLGEGERVGRVQWEGSSGKRGLMFVGLFFPLSCRSCPVVPGACAEESLEASLPMVASRSPSRG